MKLRSILLFIVGILVAQVVLIVFGFYNLFPSFDVPMHFLGGFSMALLGIYIHHAMTDKHHLKGHPDWYHILFVLGFPGFSTYFSFELLSADLSSISTFATISGLAVLNLNAYLWFNIYAKLFWGAGQSSPIRVADL